MSKKNAIIITIVAVLLTNLLTITVIGFGVSMVMSGNQINVEGIPLEEIKTFNKVKNLIEEYYVEPLDYKKMIVGSMKGFASAIGDPYTEYFDKDEFEQLKVFTNANYAGIGIVLSVDPKDNLLMITEVFEDSPSEKSKLISGDKIIQVNDVYVDGDNFDKAVQMIKGPKGTSVNITILRNGEPDPIKFVVNRDEIDIKTVKSKLLQDKVGYIRIIQFGEKTPTEFAKAVETLKIEGMEKLVIDVRDNPGGLLDEVVDISGQIIGNKLVVYTVDKNNKREDYFPKNNSAGIELPMVLLINERSASASEILSGVIKDYKKGLLIGEKTFGKGVVQSVFPLSDGSGVKITTSKYYTPNGISIHKIGVQPDIKVEIEDKNQVLSNLPFEDDAQLKKALEVLNNQ